MDSRPNLLEQRIMGMLLAGDDATLQILREQFRVAEVTQRELTGAGFFTTFLVPPQVPRLEGDRTFTFGDVIAEMEGLEHGAGFLLYVRNGSIDCLEGYSYEEAWPDTVSGLRLSYPAGAARDLPGLRRKWGDSRNSGDANRY